MKFIDIVQGTDEWHSWRRTGVTASEARILLGLDPDVTLWRLWALKTGRAVSADISRNPLVINGNRLEPRARLCAEIVLSETCLLPVCVQSTQYPLALASLDGITSDGRPVELKVPSSKCYEEVVQLGEQSEPYRRYLPQVQHQLLITGVSYGWLLFYNPSDDGDYRIFKIDRDEAVINELVQEIPKFFEHVLNDNAPEVDQSRDIYMPQAEADIRSWCHHADYLRRLDHEMKALARKVDLLKERAEPHRKALIALMGDFVRSDYAGVSLTKVSPKGDIDYQKLLKDKGICLSESDVNVYRKAAKKEHYRMTCSEEVMPKNFQISEITKPLLDVTNKAVSGFF